MKRAVLSLLFAISICWASARQPVDDATMKVRKHGFASTQLPKAELEATFHIPRVTPVHPVTRHFMGSAILPYTISLSATNSLTGSALVLTGVHAKKYLLHIYPAMHFW